MHNVSRCDLFKLCAFSIQKNEIDEKQMYNGRTIGIFTKRWYPFKTRTFTVSLSCHLRGLNCYYIVAGVFIYVDFFLLIVCIFYTKSEIDENPMYDCGKSSIFTKSRYPLKTRTFTASLLCHLRCRNCFDIITLDLSTCLWISFPCISVYKKRRKIETHRHDSTKNGIFIKRRQRWILKLLQLSLRVFHCNEYGLNLW